MFFEEIYQRLQLTGKGGFVSLSCGDWSEQVQLPERIVRLIKDQSCPLAQLSSMFCFGGKPLIFFFENPQDEASLHKVIWNLNEIPIVVIYKDNVIQVYNGFAYTKELNSLILLGGEEVLDDFEYFKMVTGQGWDDYRERLEYHNRVDYFLLKNIQYAQEKIQQANVSRNLANRLIGKMIFLRYLTDRNIVLRFEGRQQVLTNSDLIELFQDKDRLTNLFDALQDKKTGFNGDLFKITKEELSSLPNEALNVIVSLLKSEDLESGEYLLFDVYDFSILPVEFISNVYERFIGKENQERKGAYYTPLFLVDYIIENTVAKHLAKTDKSACKILDPACGSGIFLVESLRRIIDHYKSHAKPEELEGERFQNRLKQLTLENIFGIDSDESAVQVAAFSIYLTLLDYQNPADVSTFRFPNLLETNILCQDSFLKTPFDGIKFDYIIGNPPWKRGWKEYDEAGSEIIPEYQKYIKNKEQEEHCRIVNNQEIAQAFVVRTFDFLHPEAHCALVLTSKILYNIQSRAFRSYFLGKAQINSVLELSSVRHEVFSQSSDPSIAPACVVVYKRMPENGNINNHLIAHTALKPSMFFSLFKVLTAEKADVQYVRQTLLRENDYLWKILMYGTYLDFFLIRRLRSKNTIADELARRNYISGMGVTCGKKSNRNYDISSYVGKRRIDAEDVHQFFVVPSDKKWEETSAQWGRRPDLFEAPLLLVKKSISSRDYMSKAAVLTSDAIYTDALNGIHGEDVNVLRNIAGILNSRFFSYYALMSMSSIGIEREQSHLKEKLALPYIGGEIYRHVEKIEHSYRLLNEDPLLHRDEEARIEKERQQIENCISKELQLNDTEKALLDYGYHYSVPLSTGESKGSYVVNNKEGQNYIKRYAEVFIDRFKGQFGEGVYISFECKMASSHVLLRFTVGQEEREPVFKKGTIEAIERFLLSLSVQRISEGLYLRKDVRGFEKEGFYIVKPAERRLWHSAVAYVDVQEFADALLGNGLNEVGI